MSYLSTLCFFPELPSRGVLISVISGKKSGAQIKSTQRRVFETQTESLKAASGLPTEEAGTGQAEPKGLRTFQLRRVTTLEGAFAAKGGALRAGEGGGVDMMLLRDATVHRLTCHLLVPLALSAGHGDPGSRLEGRGGHSELWQTVAPRLQLRVSSGHQETDASHLTVAHF